MLGQSLSVSRCHESFLAGKWQHGKARLKDMINSFLGIYGKTLCTGYISLIGKYYIIQN